jgi:hypothetical protein
MPQSISGNSRKPTIGLPFQGFHSLRANWKNAGTITFYRSEAYANHPGQEKWQLLRISEAPGTFSKPWNEQRLLIGNDYEVPPVRVMAYSIISHYFATGKLLFQNVSVLTSSVDSDDGRAGIGIIDGHLCFGGYPSPAFSEDLSIACARKSQYN